MQEKPSFNQLRNDIATSLAILTRLPVRANFDRTAEAAWAYPIAGGIIALLAGLLASLVQFFGLPSGPVVLIAMTGMIVMSGAMHEDGLADCADGFWGAWDKPRRLEIMHDSRIGTYGVLALGLALLFKFSALSEISQQEMVIFPLISAAVLSRAGMIGVMSRLPHARTDGLSVRTGRPSGRTAAIGMIISFIIACCAVGFTMAVISGIVVATLAFGVAQVARAKIGGQSGDVLGAVQIICEIGVLLALSL